MVLTQTKEPALVETRKRWFPNTCGVCKHFYPAGLDEPDDPPFCALDSRTVAIYQVCGDWQRYHGEALTTTTNGK
ncbi:hypothetical protein LCGC14_0538810 [marine sediment metagenome]|uniref:Uncharacterized protein n=1 Tax=marine sediment metagenome TaxID=412755 RepID=A0A0F9UF02_9ZZZZ